MPQLEDAQRLLPEGLVLTQQMTIPVQQGRAFKAEDCRFGIGPAVLRLVRLIEVGEHDDWREKWLKQLSDSSRRATEGVIRPLEMGLAGPNHVYLIFDWLPATLADLIPATGLPDRRMAWSVLNQLVAALAELHRVHGAHGDLRADHVLIDTGHLTHESRVWLGGVELGPLAHWSEGARLDPKSREVFPPEWHGALQAPTKQADAFALGLLAVELFAGHDASNRVATAKANAAATACDVLRQRVSRWQRTWLLKPLLAAAAHRFADGPAIRQRWRWLRWCESAVPRAALLLLLLALGLAVVWRREVSLRSERDIFGQRAKVAERSVEDMDAKRSKEVGELTASVEDLKRQMASVTGQLGEEKMARAAVEGELAKLKGVPPANTPPRPVLSDEKTAQKIWSEKLANASISTHAAALKSLEKSATPKVREHLPAWSDKVRQAWDGMQGSWTAEQRKAGAKRTRRETVYYEFRKEPWNEARKTDLVRAFWQDFAASATGADGKLKAIQDAAEKVPVTSWLRAAVMGWLKPLQSAAAKWERWKSQPLSLTTAWLERIGDPGNADKVAREAASLVALDKAEREWRSVDARGKMTWGDFQQQFQTAVAATGNAEAMTIATTWINEFNKLTDVSFALVSGDSPEKSGTYRTIDVHVDGSNSALDDESGHNWSEDKKHDYGSAPITVKAPWKPGESLQLKVYGERLSKLGGLRPTYINQTFDVPIAAWRLAEAGSISTGEHTLVLKVVGCPGPPQRPADVKRIRTAAS